MVKKPKGRRRIELDPDETWKKIDAKFENIRFVEREKVVSFDPQKHYSDWGIVNLDGPFKLPMPPKAENGIFDK